MKNIAQSFMVLAVLSVLVGMVWGIQMSATHDHLLAPAHAHLNLLGWVTLALFAIYYRLTPSAAAGGLARIHLVLAALAAILIGPGVALAILGKTEALAIIASLLALAAMAVFLVVVLKHGFATAE